MIEKLVSRPWRNRYAHHISARSTFKPKGAVQVAWRDAIQASEGLIVSGAGAINDDFAPHGVASWDLMIAWAVQAKKPVAIIGQGIGPLEIRLNRVVARRMLNRADVISVRERRSLEVVKGLGVVCEPSVTPDWAIISEPTPCDREIAKTLMRELTAGEKFFAISLHRTATTRSPNLAKLASLSLSFLELAEADGYRTVFIPNMTAGRYSDDRETARDIETRWSRGDRSRLIVVDGGISPGVTRALLGLSDGLVSTRYHPLVFALSEGVPSLGISHDAYYDQKLLGASEMFGVAANVKRLGDPNLTAQWVLNVLRNQTVPKLEDTVKRQIERPLLSFLSRS